MKKEMDPRIARAIDGLLSPEEMAAFQTDVVRNAQLRAVYVEQMWLHQSLRSMRSEIQDSFRMPPIAIEGRWRLSALFWPVLAAASIVLAAGVYFSPKPPVAAKMVATIVQADNCKWAGSDLPTATHSRLSAGTIVLAEGIATIAFQSGAIVTLEAPTKFQIRDAMHCRLWEGAVTAEVPEPAHGFTIDAPDLKVVDLGTRFGLTASAVGNSQVRVFEGEVDVSGLPDGKVKRITKGNGMHVRSGSTLAGQEPVQGVQMPEPDGWTAIPSSFGLGKDAYSRRGDIGSPQGGEPLLIVKHSDIQAGRNNERRAVVTFDLSQITTADVEEAEFILTPVPSGFGFSSLVPDSCFAVYGLTDESLDNWDERQLRWTTTPGCSDAGPDSAQVVRLGEFWIPRGGTSGAITVRGQGFAEFVRKDTNGLVSFLIVRETGETDPNGLAHGFASKEHPSARPPTLRIKSSRRP